MAFVKREQIYSSFAWKLAESLIAFAMQFVISIALARLVEPAAYGVIAITSVFISFVNSFIQNGLSPSLIQKAEVDELDYSSVMAVNVGLAVIIYLILFFTAPLISNFYNMPELCSVLRVISLVIIPCSMMAVLNAYISRNMDFKRLFWRNGISVFLAGTISIFMAIRGFAVWALVAQQMIYNFLFAILIFFSLKWKLSFKCSFHRVKGMLSFSFKVLLATMVGVVSDSLSDLVIGKKVNATSLGYFSKGKTIPGAVSSIVNGTFASVMFPALSSYQSDIKRLKDVLRNSIRVGSCLCMPIMGALAVVSTPVVNLLFTAKWLPCVPVMQFACLYACFIPLLQGFAQGLLAVNKSDIRLVMEIIKLILMVALVFLIAPYGIYALAAVPTIMIIPLMIIMDIFFYRRIFGYGPLEQLADTMPYFGLTLLSCGIAYLPAVFFQIPDIPLIILQLVLAFGIYCGLCKLFKVAAFKEAWETATGLVKGKLKGAKGAPAAAESAAAEPEPAQPAGAAPEPAVAAPEPAATAAAADNRVEVPHE